MPQDTGKILPKFINTDRAYSADNPDNQLRPDESPFIKGVDWDINSNPENGIGTNNASGDGQNTFVLTPSQSNELIDIQLPSGINRRIGYFESRMTQEGYYFNHNQNGDHGIYVIDGNSGTVQKVIVDPKLAFSDDPEAFITNRVCLRIVRDKDNNIIEKHLIWTNGKKWQGWVNVVAAIGSNGFDTSLYPYWKTLPPHFDREELLEWPVRPPMYKPVIEVVPNTAADKGKINRVADRAFRFAFAFQYTDGRRTKPSPYSLPSLVKTEEYLNNIDNLPKKIRLTMYAGSCMVEKILIYVQQSNIKNDIDSSAAYGNWKLYDTIDKFTTQATGDYWERTNPWADFSYDDVFNTIKYTFDNSKTGTQITQEDFIAIQTGMPQVSQALSDLDDATILSNNRYNYDSLSDELAKKLDVLVVEKTNKSCTLPLRNVRLYAYIGRPGAQFSYISQVGYYEGDDKQMRFGGLITGRDSQVGVDVGESKYFKLDFADRDAFTCYFKGTPYFAVGKWFQVNSDFSLVRVDNALDVNSADVREYIQRVFVDRGFFVCVFDFKVPAGKYNAAIGRHNIESSGDYRGQSTYVAGIANSRQTSVQTLPDVNGNVTITSIKPDALKTSSKEMEVDCTIGDVDVWGNNADLFYIYCPDYEGSGRNVFRFIEGYLKESADTNKSVELFPYRMVVQTASDVTDACGDFTDKNGFYWAKTRVRDSDDAKIRFITKLNCQYPTRFIIPTSQSGPGWKINNIAYLKDNNNGEVGDCNRILVRGRITNIGGTIGYTNIAVSIKDGETVYTDNDGNFTLVVHNGQNQLRTGNIYINAGGNFLITTANCGPIPLNSFSEALIQCVDCNQRVYPININLQIEIQNNTELSLKEGGKYPVGIVAADLAGRMTNVTLIKEVEVSTFLNRNNTNATYLRLLINSALNIFAENPDLKWVSPYVGKNANYKRYVEWVGDEIIYLDNNGIQINDPASASFVKIVIQSLYDANLRSNFSILSTYQFVKGDKLRVFDDGDGRLFNVSTFGDPIDTIVLGTNYNQAAINAGLLPPATNTVLDNNNQVDESEVGIIVKYDARFDKLKNKTGFWIEIYAPVQENENSFFYEVPGFYPVIGGDIAEFTGYNNGQPTYNFPVQINLDFWDTYYLQRNIGGKYFNHPFNSPNVTDSWGANLISGGRVGIINKDAKQLWLGGDVIKSDSFLKNGFVNGLNIFRDENRKNYGIYPFGEIVVTITRRNIVLFICTADYFMAEYNMPYAKAGPNGLLITNLSENLSSPAQKTGALFGVRKSDIETIIESDDFIFWYDNKNSALVKCNFSDAIDISREDKQKGERGGMQSYLNAKTLAINSWNNEHELKDRFDVVGGIDAEHGHVYLTFRPRRNNSNELSSYVNQMRNLRPLFQETFVYNIDERGWLPFSHYTPEGYGRLRGSWANVEFFTFAAGKPYRHSNLSASSFLKYYGIQCEPSIIAVVNKTPDMTKILQAVSQEINGSSLFADIIYDTQQDSLSYLPANYFKDKEKNQYSEVLRNMVSYPPIEPDQLFRSMLHDGKRIFGSYFICRFVQKFEDLGSYFQLSGINYLIANSFPTKP